MLHAVQQSQVSNLVRDASVVGRDLMVLFNTTRSTRPCGKKGK